MIYADALLWRQFLDWHIRTDHAWDLSLHLEVMGMSIEGLGREIGEVLLPAIEKATASMRAFGAALAEGRGVGEDAVTERDDEPLPVDHPDRIAWCQRINEGAWLAYRMANPGGGGERWTMPWIKPMKRNEEAA